jgi:hypothetical protein
MKKKNKQSNRKKNNFWTHKSASLVKSVFRIFAAINIALQNWLAAALLLVIAEFFGIVEELV